MKNNVLQHLKLLTPVKKLLIAYSGGLDSHVLLHLLATLPTSEGFQLRAIHIEHGLQSIAKQWPEHCRTICKNLAVDYESISLELTILKGQSLEAVARWARYQAFSQVLQKDEVLVTAHHQDDQAETLLIQLFRGAGVNGLAAMPAIQQLSQGQSKGQSKTESKGQHIRPLLNQSRQALTHYAHQHGLDFIEDPSNQQQRYDRNFLRHTIIPRLKNRWISINQCLARAAQHQAEAKHLLAEYVEQDLPNLKGQRNGTLSIAKLKHLSNARCKAVIRYFIDKKGFLSPSEKKLRHIISDVLNAKPSATPCVQWQGVEMRRYQDDLYAITPLSTHNAQQIIQWNISQPLQLPSLKRTLTIEQLKEISELLVEKNQKIEVEVRFRQGGEKIYQKQQQCNKSLKKILQERHIPTWKRDRIPLIYIDNRLVLLLF